MTTKKTSDTVLVYDRYYNKKPNTALLTLKRILLCCGITVCAMLFLLTEYDLPVDLWAAAGLCLAFSAFFSLVFVFVKKRFAIPVILFVAGMIIWRNFDAFWERFSYFADAAILLPDGRLFDTKPFLIHTEGLLNEYNPYYMDGVMLGTGVLCAVFALITAASMFRKTRVLASFITFFLLWAPRLASEKLYYNLWIVPTVALYMGAAALAVSYGEGLALRRGLTGSYRRAVNKDEREFENRISKTPYVTRTEMRNTYYSKYFSVAVYAAALFLTAGSISNSVFEGSRGIDYTGFYDFVMKIGTSSGITSPFESGPLSEYFTSPSQAGEKPKLGLGITSPGQSNQEILRVTNTGTFPVYLRGDYGIDFIGNSWTSPTSIEPEEWKSSGLRNVYRPVEMLVLQNFLSELGRYYDDYTDLEIPLDTADITVDYLCQTNVVFLPAYTSDFGYYENEMFDIYGDYVARVNDDYDKMNTIRCTAIVPSYISTDSSRGVIKSANTYTACGSFLRALDVNRFEMRSVADSLLRGNSVLNKYKDYVNETYLGVPAEMSEPLRNYLQTREFSSDFWDKAANVYDLRKRYEVAAELANHLRDNYTYSLNAKNDTRNPVMSFLNDTKSGHCALYASAMTLMLREMGIPARYCTGFVAQPNGVIPTTLRSKNLHAWCEVYFDELGWVTFDPTSSSVTGTPSASSRPSDSSSESSEISESSEPSSSSESSSSSRSSADSEPSSAAGEPESRAEPTEPVNVLPYVLIILGIAAAGSLAALVIGKYKNLDKNARKALRRYYGEGSAEIIHAKILGVLQLCGISPTAGELPEKFYARAEKTLGCRISSHTELLISVAFGARRLSDSEHARLGRLLEAVFNAADKRLKLLGRIRLRRLVLSKRIKK